jgi:probable phosphoglycerate mutase
VAGTRKLPMTGPSLFDFAADEAPAPAGSLIAATDPASTDSDVPAKLIIRADGGSRGNPGQAAYGALVYDAATQKMLNREGRAIGIASNNVAEYSGLIAGLEMVRAINPAAEVEVRMDSKLVIEQMAGRWKIKNPDMRKLAVQANALRPARITWTWVPRSENKDADALVNQALDGDPHPRK